MWRVLKKSCSCWCPLLDAQQVPRCSIIIFKLQGWKRRAKRALRQLIVWQSVSCVCLKPRKETNCKTNFVCCNLAVYVLLSTGSKISANSGTQTQMWTFWGQTGGYKYSFILTFPHTFCCLHHCRWQVGAKAMWQWCRDVSQPGNNQSKQATNQLTGQRGELALWFESRSTATGRKQSSQCAAVICWTVMTDGCFGWAGTMTVFTSWGIFYCRLLMRRFGEER